MEQQIRARMVEAMRETVLNEPRWHYREVRPLALPTVDAAYHGIVYSDCSFGCSIIAHLAGGPDPTGDGWQGNSTSMFHHLPHLTRGQIQPGDFAVFGPNGDQHAVCIYEVAADPIVWSHGQERGPQLVRLSVEIAYHQPPVTFLRGVPADPAVPKPKPTVKTPAIHGEAKNEQPFTRRYYTLRRNVPVKRGQSVHFAPGHGYYAA